MSSSDTAAAKQAAGQIQKQQAELTGSDHRKSAGQTEFQHGKGIENAQEGTGASGFGPVAGAKDAVKEQASARKDE